MGTFDIHSDANLLPMVSASGGSEAMGLFVVCGTWTASHGRQGVVPREVVERFANGRPEPVALLLEAGLWELADEGYRMLHGPSDELEGGLPLWRYSDDDLGGRLLSR